MIGGMKPFKENSMNMKRILACYLLLTILALTGCGPSLSVEEASALLIEATRDGDLAGVTRALKQGADIETTEPIGGLTPLIIAANNGFTEIAAHLIDAGADVNATSEQGMTPLIGAALKGYTEIATLLLERGADVDAANSQGVTPLIAAAQNGHVDVVTLLAANHANLDQLSKTQYKQNALHLAAKFGHTAVIEALLKAGADVNALEGSNSTALMYASYNGHLEAVDLLIKHGIELNVRDNGGKTALYMANQQNHPDIAALISTAGGTE
jgi:ankyrin repeat protein